MTESDRNVAVASGAQIALRGLVRLNPADLDWPVQTVPNSRALPGHRQPRKAQATSAIEAMIAAATKT